jgi:hypothetical protein
MVVALVLFWSTPESESLPPSITVKARSEDSLMERMVVSVRESEPVEQVPQPPPIAVAELLATPAPLPTIQPATEETPAAQTPKVISSQGGEGNASADEGIVLPIYADYRSEIGFPAYAEAMHRVGGIFLIFDGERIRGEVDVIKRKVLPIAPARLAGLSPCSREVTEPALVPCLEEAKRLLGPGFYSIILLVPKRVDQHVQSVVAKELRSRGLDPSSVTQVRGRYVSNEGRLMLTLTEAVSRTRGTAMLQGSVAF